MRSTLLFTAFLLAFCTTAQSPYRPFPASGAGWVVAAGGLHFNCNPVEQFMSTRTFVVGDTVQLGGIDHLEVWMREEGFWMAVGPPAGGPCPGGGDIDIPWYVAMHLRQDVAARRVYVGPNDTTDLLYDFSIGLGTYPQTVNNFEYPNTKVVALDSMLLNDGYHRTWVLGMDYGGGIQDSAFCTIIEGVGSTYGPSQFVPMSPPFEFSDVLTCFSDVNVIYPLGATLCDISMGLPPAPVHQITSLAPNPAGDHVRVTFTGMTTRAWIVDATGRVSRPVVLVEGTNELSLRGLVAGAYALRTGAGEVIRFLKE